MFQFRRFPTHTYFIQYTLTDLHLPGCPIRISSDIAPAYGSPRLFAVNRVLHRLPVPRHSPCALCSLTSFLIRLFILLCFILNPDRRSEQELQIEFKANIMRSSLNDLSYSLVDNCNYIITLFKILCLFKTVDIVSYLSFVLHYFVQFSRCEFRR